MAAVDAPTCHRVTLGALSNHFAPSDRGRLKTPFGRASPSESEMGEHAVANFEVP